VHFYGSGQVHVDCAIQGSWVTCVFTSLVFTLPPIESQIRILRVIKPDDHHNFDMGRVVTFRYNFTRLFILKL